MHTRPRLLTFAILALAAFAAHAQEAGASAAAAAPVDIQLGIDSGSVLVSTGGEFSPATQGQALAPGQRVLVSEDSAATLTYGNGCQKALGTPGVYTIGADCVAAGRQGTGPSAGTIAGIVGGVALIAAAAGGGGGGNSPPPPVSR